MIELIVKETGERIEMSNVSSLELCKELYKLSDWLKTYHYWDLETKETTYNVITFRDTWEPVEGFIPAYDLGYLLRKLQERTNRIQDTWLLGLSTNNVGYSVVYKDLVMLADTPEDAVCKLAIELFKQGLLK